MSRLSPFSLTGDKRGRLRELLSSLLGEPLHDNDCQPVVFRRFSDRPAPVRRYEREVGGGSASVTLEARRLSLPSRAALVPLDDWLHPLTAARWNCPPPAEDEPGRIRAYFPVSMVQWRASVRRMFRAGLAVALPPCSASPSLAAGAFAVVKDAALDRLIADRRPENAREGSAGLCLLPYSPRLRRVRLKRQQYIRCSVRDIRNMYYMFRVDDARLVKQIIGPRIPRSWLEDIHDEELDVLPPDSFDPWWQADVWVPGGPSGGRPF